MRHTKEWRIFGRITLSTRTFISRMRTKITNLFDHRPVTRKVAPVQRHQKARICSISGLFVVMLVLIFPCGLLGQERPGLDDSLLVNSIDIQGNSAFSDAELMDGIHLKESPGGFYVWIYDNISERFGSEPQFFDYEVFQKDIENLQQFYKNNG